MKKETVTILQPVLILVLVVLQEPTSIKNIIFNDLLIDWNKPITLVEGPFDSIKMGNSILYWVRPKEQQSYLRRLLKNKQKFLLVWMRTHYQNQ